MLHDEKTDKIIGAFYKVYNKLGYGFLERVYQNALLIELRKLGLHSKTEKPVKVFYDGELVGDYRADIIVENCIIIENKAAASLAVEHEFQLIPQIRKKSKKKSVKTLLINILDNVLTEEKNHLL